MRLINGNEFKEITKTGLVLVDFYADWCGPCKMMAPILEEIDKECDDVEIVKLNVDADGEIAGSFGVQSIPTMILFKDGKAIATTMGYQAKPQIMDFIKQGL
ncbi:MAG: thioredoxin [Breznakia sp.]